MLEEADSAHRPLVLPLVRDGRTQFVVVGGQSDRRSTTGGGYRVTRPASERVAHPNNYPIKAISKTVSRPGIVRHEAMRQSGQIDRLMIEAMMPTSSARLSTAGSESDADAGEPRDS